ncbi:hypothetical protein [Sporanaerobacter acetigenes]|uniref:hypothetical protein n=1 Tax=Sporanaerobacter acetigenes TaxID=165813 RepID=UPI001160C844|nr:hypothetical protein [Sporanaerobacter acetigenes]
MKEGDNVETAASIFGWCSLVVYFLAFLNIYYTSYYEKDGENKEPNGFAKFIDKGFKTFAIVAIITIVLHFIYIMNYTSISWVGISAGILAIIGLIIGLANEGEGKKFEESTFKTYQVFNYLAIIMAIIHLFVKA